MHRRTTSRGIPAPTHFLNRWRKSIASSPFSCRLVRRRRSTGQPVHVDRAVSPDASRTNGGVTSGPVVSQWTARPGSSLRPITDNVTTPALPRRRQQGYSARPGRAAWRTTQSGYEQPAPTCDPISHAPDRCSQSAPISEYTVHGGRRNKINPRPRFRRSGVDS